MKCTHTSPRGEASHLAVGRVDLEAEPSGHLRQLFVVELEEPASLGVLHAQLRVDERFAKVDVEHPL